MPQALPVKEVTNRLGLHDIRNRPWHVQPTCARSGDGLYEGIFTLFNILQTKF